MTKYLVDFCDNAPTCVEQRKVDTLSVEGLVVPADAMQFSFFTEDLKWISPSYIVADEHEFGTLDGLKAKYPGSHGLFDIGDRDVAGFVRITWSHPEGAEQGGEAIVPLVADIAILDRSTGRLLWPEKAASAS